MESNFDTVLNTQRCSIHTGLGKSNRDSSKQITQHTNGLTMALQTPDLPNITLNDAFWAPKQETLRTVTLPMQYQHLLKTGRDAKTESLK